MSHSLWADAQHILYVGAGDLREDTNSLAMSCKLAVVRIVAFQPEQESVITFSKAHTFRVGAAIE